MPQLCRALPLLLFATTSAPPWQALGSPAATDALHQRCLIQQVQKPQSLEKVALDSQRQTVQGPNGSTDLSKTPLIKHERVVSDVRVVPDVAENKHDHDHHFMQAEHHSIFQLRFQQVDTMTFWVIFMLMLAFTIIVDRCEDHAIRVTEHSRTEKMFVERVNSELMMFGCVGLGMFVIENFFSHLEAHQAVLVEFVDILCSLGAVNLITIALALRGTRWVVYRRWKYLEEAEVHELSEGSFRAHSFMGPEEYQVMAQAFIEQKQLPSDFLYYEYLKESLARNACGIMDVNWTLWAVYLVIGCGFLILNVFRKELIGGRVSTYAYLNFFTIMNWASLACFMCILLWNLRGQHLLMENILCVGSQGILRGPSKAGLASKEVSRPSASAASSSSSAAVPKGKNKEEKEAIALKRTSTKTMQAEDMNEHKQDRDGWSSWTEWGMYVMQAVTLMNSFLASAYFMLVKFNLSSEGYHWWWQVCLLMPLLISLLIFLPLSVIKYTEVQAYFAPDRESIDGVLQSMGQEEEDMNHFRRQLRERGGLHAMGKEIPEEGCKSPKELGDFLESLGLVASNARLYRLFKNFDSNKNGVCEVDELIRKLSDNDEDELYFHGNRVKSK